jgi:hypothetical protein
MRKYVQWLPMFYHGMISANTFLFTSWHGSCLWGLKINQYLGIDTLNACDILSLVMLADAL